MSNKPKIVLVTVIVVAVIIIGQLLWQSREQIGPVINGKIAQGSTIEIVHDGRYRVELGTNGSEVFKELVVDGEVIGFIAPIRLDDSRRITNIADTPVDYRVVTLDNSSDLTVKTTLSSHAKWKIVFTNTVILFLLAVILRAIVWFVT